MMDLRKLLILIFVVGVIASPNSEQSSRTQCGYGACPQRDPKKLNIHIVPHTHDDVGWLKTVHQYYYGSILPGVTSQRAGVQYILDTVIRQLKEDPKRRFVWVETAFFWMWWKKQTLEIQEVVKELVNTGRLEFISGGWSMNDEATVHYQPTIDQMTWGHRRLQDIFGKCAVTKIGWQLDPFGHSKEFASLLAQMHFDGLFFARLDYDDKNLRRKAKRTEFIWKTSNDLGPASHLLTSILPHHYSPPKGFCFDDLCSDPPIIDDPSSEDYNVNKRVSDFLNEIDGYANWYTTNNILVTMGDDFHYQNALKNFKNMDKLIKYVNEKAGKKYHAFYSTPTCYIKALHESNKNWTTKSDDFFPYASGPHSFWTGYYTSRPAFKLQERKANAMLQACKHAQLWLGESGPETKEAVASLKEAMGVAQHHDAITGTEKQHVANDYSLQLNKGVLKCQEVIKKAFRKKMKVNVSFCPALNVSQCEIMEKENKIALLIYNIRSQPVSRLIAIPWSKEAYVLKDEKGKIVLSDLIPIPESIKNLPERKVLEAKTTHEIFFTAHIPSNRFAKYIIERKPDLPSPELLPQVAPELGLELRGKDVVASFAATSLFSGLTRVQRGERSENISQHFSYYVGATGDNRGERRSSGAYIFRPQSNASEPLGTWKKSVFINGTVVREFRHHFTNWISHTIRLSKDSNFIEFDHVVGPIPIDDNKGKEIVSSFVTDFNNGKVFYTDANGRQLIKRVRNHRETWDYSSRIAKEPVSSNYYPVNSRIIMKNKKDDLQLTILTDRSLGGSSQMDSSVEVMVHRRLLRDDAFGVREALNEPGVAGEGLIIRGSYKMFVGSTKESIIHRDQAMTEYLEPQLYFYPLKSIDKDVSDFSITKNELPPNIHLLTAESWRDGKVLIRLEHFYESTDDPGNLSKPVTVDLKKFFNIESAVETTLTATQPLSEASRFKWKTVDSSTPSGGGYQSTLNPTDFTVTLRPMEIRSFLVTLANSRATLKARDSKVNSAMSLIFFVSFLILGVYGLHYFYMRRQATRVVNLSH